MKRGSAPTHQIGRHTPPLKFQPRIRLKPMGQAIQHALLRIDPGEDRTRLEKWGEMVVRKALAGDIEFSRFIADRYEGKVMPLDEDGNDDNLQGVLLAHLVEALIEKKLSKARVIDGGVTTTDVVGELVRKKLTKE